MKEKSLAQRSLDEPPGVGLFKDNTKISLPKSGGATRAGTDGKRANMIIIVHYTSSKFTPCTMRAGDLFI